MLAFGPEKKPETLGHQGGCRRRAQGLRYQTEKSQKMGGNNFCQEILVTYIDKGPPGGSWWGGSLCDTYGKLLPQFWPLGGRQQVPIPPGSKNSPKTRPQISHTNLVETLVLPPAQDFGPNFPALGPQKGPYPLFLCPQHGPPTESFWCPLHE